MCVGNQHDIVNKSFKYVGNVQGAGASIAGFAPVWFSGLSVDICSVRKALACQTNGGRHAEVVLGTLSLSHSGGTLERISDIGTGFNFPSVLMMRGGCRPWSEQLYKTMVSHVTTVRG